MSVEKNFSIPIDKPYAVVELKIDGEVYASPASSLWLSNVTRYVSEDNKTSYSADCMWPNDEDRLNRFLEKRTKPGVDWVKHQNVKVLKLCRSLGQAKTCMEEALNASDVADSDINIEGKKRSRTVIKKFDPSQQASLRKKTKSKKKVSGSGSEADASGDSDSGAPSFKLLKISSGAASNSKAVLSGSSEAANARSEMSTFSSLALSPPKQGSSTPNPSKAIIVEEEDNDEDDHIFTKRNKALSRIVLGSSDSEDSSNQSASCSQQTRRIGMNSTEDHDQLGQTSTPQMNSSVAKVLKFPESSNIASSTNLSKVQPTVSSKEASHKVTNGACGQKSETELCKTPVKVGACASSALASKKKTPKKATYSPKKASHYRAQDSYVTYKIFMREIIELKNRLDTLKVTLGKIYNSVCPVLENSNVTEDGRGLPSLPLHTFEELQKWDEYLADHDNLVHATRLLSDVGLTTSVKDCVYAMLHYILSNQLASAFNLRGKNKKNAKVKKLKFKETKSYLVMLAAVKAKRSQCEKQDKAFDFSIELVENASSQWLKDAPKRYLSELKQMKVLPADAETLPDEFVMKPPDNL